MSKRKNRQRLERDTAKSAKRAEYNAKLRAELTQDMGLTVEQARAVEESLQDSFDDEDGIDDVFDNMEDKEAKEAERYIREGVERAAQAKSKAGSAPPPTPESILSRPPVEPATTAAPIEPSVRAPMAARTVDRASNMFTNFGGFASRVFGMTPAITPEEKETRSEILKINNQLILTKTIIESNGKDLNELAKSDKDVADLLKTIRSKEFEKIESIQKLILAGQEVDKDQAALLIESLENVTSKLDSSQVSLEARFSDISAHFESLVTNDSVNREDRRSMIDELVKIGSSSSVQTQLTQEQRNAIIELKTLSKQNINFTQDQNTAVKKIFNILTDSSIDRAKLRGTLNDLNQVMDSAVLTNQDLKNKLSQKDDKGKTLKESALGGIKGIAKTGIAGGIDYLLGQFGLGGLGLGEILAGKGIGALGKGLGGLLGGAAGGAAGGIGAGGLLKGGAKLLGKAFLPLAAGMSLYDAYKGFNNAEEIAGMAPGQKAGLGTKVQAGAASAISGLSFGLLDTKSVYKGIDKGLNAIIGPDGVITTLSTWLVDAPSRFMKAITDTLGTPTEWIAKINSAFGAIGDALFGPDGFFSLSLVKKALRAVISLLPGGSILAAKMLGDESTDTATRVPAASTTTLPAGVSTRGADLATEDARRERAIREQQLTATQANKQAPIIIPPTPAPKKTIDRSAGVDDMGLAMMNHGLSGI